MESPRTGQDEPTWLTITEIARRLDAPESTVRSWRDRYREYVPSNITLDGRVYSLERIAEIKRLQQDGRRLSIREIRAELASRYPTESGEQPIFDQAKQEAEERRELVIQAITRMEELRVQIGVHQSALRNVCLTMQAIEAEVAIVLSELRALSTDDACEP